MSLTPAIFTFYSYKGGVGRSMSALNVAYRLTARGRHVLLVDMDLEAAGLSGLLARQGELPNPAPRDVIDLIQWARDVAVLDATRAGDPDWIAKNAPQLLPFLARVPDEKIAELVPQGGMLGSLHILGADQDREYPDRLTALGLTHLDADQLMRTSILLRHIFKQFRLELPVPRYVDLSEREPVPLDYVLIDSRTGLTEVGGLCVGPLADRIVVLCGLNDQNIDGTRRALEILGVIGGDPIDQPWDDFIPPPAAKVPLMGLKPTLLVASPVPSGEITLRKQRIEVMERSLGSRAKVAVELPYHPQLALYETIFVRDFPKEELAHRYDDLAELVETVVSDHASQLFRSNFELGDDSVQRTTELNRLLRLAKDEPRIGLPLLRALMDRLPELPWEEDDFKVLDRILHLLTQEGMPKPWVGTFKRAVVLGSWAEQTKMPLLAEARRREALKHIGQALKSAGVSIEDQAKMHALQGTLLIEDKSWPLAVDSLTLALRLEPKSPQRTRLLIHRGLAYRELRQAEAATQDFTEALDSNFLDLKERAKVYLGRGLSLGELGRNTESVSDLTALLAIKEAEPGDLMTARFGRAIGYTKMGESSLALAEYDVVISCDDSGPGLRMDALNNRGVLFLDKGNAEAAVRDLTAAQIQTVPEGKHATAALSNRALAYTRLEQWALALADAQSVLQTSESNANDQAHALHAAVQSYVGLGNLEAAASTYAQLESLKGAEQDLRAPAMVALGWGAYLQKDYLRSVEWSRRAIAIDENVRCTAAANIGLAFLHLGDLAAANQEYEVLVARCSKRQDLESAIHDLRLALEMQPLLPGAQPIYDNLTVRLAAITPVHE